MAQLITPDYNKLVPNFSLFGTGIQQGQQISESMANRQALNKQAQDASQLAETQSRARAGDKQALQDVAGTAFGADLQAYNAATNESERKEDLRENEELTRTSLNALSINDPIERRLFLERKRAGYIKDGRDTSNIDGALKLDDAALGQALTMQAQQGQSIADQYKRQFPAVEVQTPTSLQKNLAAAGFAPGTPEFKAEVVKSLSKSDTTINVGDGEQAFAKEMAKGQAQNVSLVREQADTAIDANQSLSVLENIDIETGALEPAKLGIAAFATAFGLDGSKIANVAGGEAFNAEAQRIVLSVKASQKGPQTDKDEITIRKTVASLGNSKQGNQFIIDSARALNNRRISRKDFYDTFLEASGGKFRNNDGQTADAAWSKFKRNTPMVSAKQRTPEGLPVFYYKFEEAVRGANPDATRGEILEAWRSAEKGAK
tara:strand:+ start:15884 stop:17179 length:1296 start_codon:yes stop_codon:yes gene_type:complete